MSHSTEALAAPATVELARQHGLTEAEYARVVEMLGRAPNRVELGIFSVMWSEHCSYKSSRVHLKRLPISGPQVVQGPGENAGVVDIGDGLCAVFKIESHNHPSFVEPFQGADTGVGGILRDIFTMGARPIAVLDSLRFGPVTSTPGLDAAVVARNRRLLEGVVSGIAFYGNCFGVPTVGGEIHFEPGYSSNPLVNVLALGVAPRAGLLFARAAGPGNPVIYVGARTGRDGIHGASLLASAPFDEQSEQKRPSVQVGDPFMEKLLLEACLEAMASGAIVAVQDMGAAGLTCSSAELAARGGVGIELDLDAVPQRETGMSAYEILLSESQERMLLVGRQGAEDRLREIFARWGLEAVVVGRVTEDGRLRVRHRGAVVADLPARPLCEEGPVYERPLVPPQAPAGPRVDFGPPGVDLTPALRQVLAAPVVASKRWVWEQYDWMVRTNTVLGPGQGDAAVVRIKGTRRGLALATDGNGRWCRLDPRLGAMHAVAEAARNVACTGARPLAVTNCLNFGSPERPEVMGQFVAVIEGMAEACCVLGTPVTGGNVSFYNETLGAAIDPTPVIGMLGLLEDVRAARGRVVGHEGQVVVLLDGQPAQTGGRERWAEEFSSSEYARTVRGIVGGQPPAVDLAAERRLIECLATLAERDLVAAAHDLSDGGLAVALAECCFGSGGLGIRAELEGEEPDELALFGERGARALVVVEPEALPRLVELAAVAGVAARAIGAVAQEEFRIAYNGRELVRARVAELEQLWEKALEQALDATTA